MKGKIFTSLFLGTLSTLTLSAEAPSFSKDELCSSLVVAHNEETKPSKYNFYINQNNLYGLVDVLFWHARTGSTYFCYKTEMPYGTSPVQGGMYDLNFGWDLGFRAGIGYDFEHDNWSLSLLYGQFVTTSSSSVNGTAISAVVPSQSIYLFDTPVSNSKSNGKIDRKSINFVLAKETFLSPYFLMKPYVGFETCWLDFSQKVSYTGGNFLSVNSVYVTNISDFWGIGPELGLGANWYLGNGFYVEGDFATSFIYGLFDVTYKDKISYSSTNYVNFKQQFHQFSPIVMFSLGIGWGTYVNQCKQFIDLSLAYEGEYWFRQNQTIQIFNSSISRYQNVGEDLSLHGATLSFEVHF